MSNQPHPHPHGEGTVEQPQQQEAPQPNPLYLALSDEQKAAVDDLIASMNRAQEQYDGSLAALTEVFFWMGGVIIQQDLVIRTMKETIDRLEGDVTQLKQLVS